LPREETLNREFAESLARCDICVVDLDQCLFPGFSHTRLGQLAFARCCVTPLHWRWLPTLIGGGLYIMRVRLRELSGRRAPTEQLMTAFDRCMRGLPLPLITSAARLLPRLAQPGWPETLGLIARRMPVCLLSWAIRPIVTAFAQSRDRRGQLIFTRAYGNPVTLAGEGNEARIERCWLPESLSRPEHKLQVLKQWMKDLGKHRPLVIGHGPDEVPMAALARKAGGLSIGTNPHPDLAGQFDIAIRQWTWRPLHRLLRTMLG